MGEQIIQEVKEALSELFLEGDKILETIKKEGESHSFDPSFKTLEKLFIEEESFTLFLFESFWKLFKIIKENIENPIVQPWIRVILEQSSDMIWYLDKNERDKEKIACKYWLCTLGFLGGKHSNLNYDNFLNLLINSNELEKFSKLKEESYPVKKIHKIWHDLFPSISEENMPDFIKNYYLTLKGNSIKKSQIDIFFRHMSLYHHPNLIINNLEKEDRDKSHIFRCFALLSICGLAIIKFSNERKIYSIKKETIEELNKKVNNLFQKFGKIRDFKK